MPVDKDLINMRVDDVYEAINELKRITSKSFNELSIDEKYSMRYNVIVLVESLASLCLHIALEYYGFKPRSYAECFRRVLENLNVKCYEDLEALARLRNILIHRYWIIRDEVIYSDIEKDFICVLEFISRIKELIT